MGTDIHGWVEFRDAALDTHFDEKDWYSVIDAGILLDRSYAMFGSLFGVRNPTDFAPVAAGRGLPDEVAASAAWEDNHSHTWVAWDELRVVNWDEEAQGCVAWAYMGGSTNIQTRRWLSADDPHCHHGATWVEDGLVFTAERVTRRDAAGGSWQLLMEMANPLVRRL